MGKRMAELSKFTQANESPEYFIDFLNFLDNQEEISKLRTELGCGIGGATFLIADLTGLRQHRNRAPALLKHDAIQGTSHDDQRVHRFYRARGSERLYLKTSGENYGRTNTIACR